ncbi:tetratricopeptide repeat protein [Ursidibacter sp. B-7004-1]
MKKLIPTLFTALMLSFSLNSQAKTYSANSKDLQDAKNGDVYAMLNMARQFDPSDWASKPVDNQEKDIEIAYEWYEKAGEKGDKEAASWLGHYYLNKKAYDEAVYWFIEKNGRKGGFYDKIKYVNGQLFSAEVYRKGIVVKKELAKALEIYQTLWGNVPMSFLSEISLLTYLTNAEINGQMTDFNSLLKQAEKADSKWAQWFGVNNEVMKLVGVIYLLGEYPENADILTREATTKPDYQKAKFWLEKYANLSNDSETAYWLGRGLNGMKGDIKWLKKAADLKEKNALFEMGAAHYKGKIAIKDPEQAKHYAKLACEEGNKRGCSLYRDIVKYSEYSDMYGAKTNIDWTKTDYEAGLWE